MSYYPPKGKEKQVLQKIIQLSKQLESEFKLVKTDASFHISMYHALEGVRVNGWERTDTLLDVFNALKTWDDNLQDEARKIAQDAELLAETRLEIESLMEQFNICPVCHGEKGEKVDGTMKNHFTDCQRCEGRGIVIL